MFEITFYNENGQIVLGGGSSNSNFKVIKTDGLGFCGKTYNTVAYVGVDGQETVSEKMNPRVITISGDYFLSNNYSVELSNAFYVLNKNGILEVQTPNGKRKIAAKCTEFLKGEIEGKFMPFTVQFICDEPYFESVTSYEIPIYKIIPNINSEFTFPGVFSTRISRRIIMINSDASSEPIIIINCGSNPVGDIEIINHTHGEKIKLDYSPCANECITIDVRNRKIYNQDGDNLLNNLSDESFFDGFHLYPGGNDIEVKLDSPNSKLDVMCQYNERFLEAVY